jgi:DNA mismatch endonuclease (patch repair protein)
MTDVVDAITRSRMMSGIRGKNTKPEKLVRSLLHRQGFRFRLHVSNLPGKPDIVLPRYNAVIFVHGCFWHRHACRFFKWPQTRPDFWREKIARNCSNDLKSRRALKKEGWRIGIVWECAVRGAGKDTENITYRIGEWLHGDKSSMEIRG